MSRLFHSVRNICKQDYMACRFFALLSANLLTSTILFPLALAFYRGRALPGCQMREFVVLGAIGLLLVGLPVSVLMIVSRSNIEQLKRGHLLVLLVSGILAGTTLVFSNLIIGSNSGNVHLILQNGISASSEKQFYYILGIANAKGDVLVDGRTLVSTAAECVGARVNGTHLHSSLPAHGDRFKLDWNGLVPAKRGTPLFLSLSALHPNCRLHVKSGANEFTFEAPQVPPQSGSKSLLPIGCVPLIPFSTRLMLAIAVSALFSQLLFCGWSAFAVSRSTEQYNDKPTGKDVLSVLLISAILLIVHFNETSGMGLYDDDFMMFFYRDQPFDVPYSRLVGNGLLRLIAKLQALSPNSLSLPYAIAFYIRATTLAIGYLALKRMFGHVTALTAVIIISIHPADGAAPMLIRLLAGAHLAALPFAFFIFFNAHSAHLLAALALFLSAFIYEPFILPALLVPALCTRAKPKLLTAERVVAYLHVFCACGLAVAIRFCCLPQGRLGDLNELTTLTKVLRSLQAGWLGMQASAKAMVIRAPDLFQSASSMNWVVGVCVFSIFIYLVIVDNRLSDSHSDRHGESSFLLQPFVKSVLVLLGMWFVSYALFIQWGRFPPTALFGRNSEVHIAAIWPLSILYALLLSRLLWLRVSDVGKVIPLFITGLFMLFSGAYGSMISNAMVDNWRIKKDIYREIAKLVPEGYTTPSAIILDSSVNALNKHAYVFTWESCFVMQHLQKYAFQAPEIILSHQIGTQYEIDQKTGTLKPITGYQNGLARRDSFAVSNLAWLAVDGSGHLVRKHGLFRIGGLDVTIQKPSDTIYAFRAKGPLGSLVDAYPYAKQSAAFDLPATNALLRVQSNGDVLVWPVQPNGGIVIYPSPSLQHICVGDRLALRFEVKKSNSSQKIAVAGENLSIVEHKEVMGTKGFSVQSFEITLLHSGFTEVPDVRISSEPDHRDFELRSLVVTRLPSAAQTTPVECLLHR